MPQVRSNESCARRLPTPSINVNRQLPGGDSVICVDAFSAKEIALESKLIRRSRVCNDRSLLCECSDARAPNHSRLARNPGQGQFAASGGDPLKPTPAIGQTASPIQR